jgi:predicted MFS family arabinose efflux permease
MSNQGSEGTKVDARYRTMLIVWFAILMSVGLMFFLTLVMERPPAGKDNTLLFVFAAASIFPLLLSFVMKSKLLAQSVKEQKMALVQTAMIIAIALCETVGLFGMMVFFTTASPYYYIFFIVSVISILLHMPRRDQLLAASYKTLA